MYSGLTTAKISGANLDIIHVYFERYGWKVFGIINF